MKQISQFNWSTYRNKYVYYGSKKIKLRKYMQINANIMRMLNKPKWVNIDHYRNYKIAVGKYGLPGLKFYEERFYKDKPMPYDRSIIDNILYWLEAQFIGIKIKFNQIIKYLNK